MKKIIVTLLFMLMLTSLFGCGKDANTSKKADDSTESENPMETEPEVDTQKPETSSTKDYDAMLDLLLNAERVNSEISDAVNAYNNRSADAAQTIAVLKSLQTDFSDVLASYKAVKWETTEYSEQGTKLGTGLNGLEEFFLLAIEGLEKEDWDMVDKSFTSRQIYYDYSDEVYSWFQTQQY